MALSPHVVLGNTLGYKISFQNLYNLIPSDWIEGLLEFLIEQDHYLSKLQTFSRHPHIGWD